MKNKITILSKEGLHTLNHVVANGLSMASAIDELDIVAYARITELLKEKAKINLMELRKVVDVLKEILDNEHSNFISDALGCEIGTEIKVQNNFPFPPSIPGRDPLNPTKKL